MTEIMNIPIAEILTAAMFFVSLYGLIVSNNIVKSIIALVLMEMAVIMFIVSIGFAEGMRAPIGTELENAADPLPQALLLTAIVIGISITAVNVTFFISLYRQYKTTDWDIVQKKNAE